MNFSGKLLIAFCKIWPFRKGHGRLISIAKFLFSRTSPRNQVLEREGFRLNINLDNNKGWGNLLFAHWFDYQERKLICQQIDRLTNFLDIGANLGFYSLYVATRPRFRGKVYSFEANPTVFEDLCANIDLNALTNTTATNIGVSDRAETIEFYVHPSNYGGSSFIKKDGVTQSIPVKCLPLLDLCRNLGLRQIDFLKIDIEGLEFKVLSSFFKNADPALYPKHILTEFHSKMEKVAGGNTVELILDNGYKLEKQIGLNYYFTNHA